MTRRKRRIHKPGLAKDMMKISKFPQTSTMAARYGVAVMTVLSALLLTHLLWRWIEPHPTSLFLAAVTVSAWYGGLRPSLLSTALAAVTVDYFFIGPVYHLELSVDNAVRTIVFILVALLISWVDAARKRAIEERDRLLLREQEARQAAEAANRTKDEFLAMVTHELRTPLSVISGWAEMLLKGDLNEEATRIALETINRNAGIQRHLIDDLLDVSRISSGKLRIEAKRIELVPVIEDAIEVVTLAAEAKGIKVHKEYDTSADIVNGDPARLKQVFWNLLSNAVKFTPTGGRIDVRLERVAYSARIIVSDTGQGIPQDFLPHVFERFSQEKSGDSERTAGLGLGLSIVRHLVEMHGGTVGAESEGIGRGATFTVTLPLYVDKEGVKPEFRASDERLVESVH